jgi:hypothetical protein
VRHQGSLGFCVARAVFRVSSRSSSILGAHLLTNLSLWVARKGYWFVCYFFGGFLFFFDIFLVFFCYFLVVENSGGQLLKI